MEIAGEEHQVTKRQVLVGMGSVRLRKGGESGGLWFTCRSQSLVEVAGHSRLVLGNRSQTAAGGAQPHLRLQ